MEWSKSDQFILGRFARGPAIDVRMGPALNSALLKPRVEISHSAMWLLQALSHLSGHPSSPQQVGSPPSFHRNRLGCS